ncbi:MAG: hypothetical protein GY832_27230 [Chloroflexi bacterium]|nr:hypothetical protein [Chloroflexota bacterium]
MNNSVQGAYNEGNLFRIETHTDEYLFHLKRACAQPSISAQGEGITEMANLVAEMLSDGRMQILGKCCSTA